MEANDDDDGETKKGFQNSVFIKNLNFETTEKTMQDLLKQKGVK